MKLPPKQPLLTLCAWACSLNTYGQSVDLQVTGIITPPACMISIDGGTVFDFGSIPASSLHPDTETPLGNR
ncbi:DUF1120 domain-containing protein [Burkholderia cenocepacia]|uniref:DUF1120 domain-containing protein n=1 Tax=Burkholderia cenocepacia TaxID=95486 RepID=UPI0028654F46|nr:DUF1120 domain-containing protein [Burkholderia cenocepacia]MDR8046030.1 DUF1120 domain-containing protein [Burkholderia cenocepacia]